MNNYKHAINFLILAAIWLPLAQSAISSNKITIKKIDDLLVYWNKPMAPLRLFGFSTLFVSMAATLYFQTPVIAHLTFLLVIVVTFYYIKMGNNAVVLAFGYVWILYFIEFFGLFDVIEDFIRKIVFGAVNFDFLRAIALLALYETYRFALKKIMKREPD